MREIGRRHVAPLEERCERRNRQERQVVERRRARRRRLSVTLILAPGVAPGFGFLPGRYGRKVIAGSVSSGMSMLAKLLEGVEIAVDASERLLLFGVGEVDAEDLLAAVERLLSFAAPAPAAAERRGGQTPGTAAGIARRNAAGSFDSLMFRIVRRHRPELSVYDRDRFRAARDPEPVFFALKPAGIVEVGRADRLVAILRSSCCVVKIVARAAGSSSFFAIFCASMPLMPPPLLLRCCSAPASSAPCS